MCAQFYDNTLSGSFSTDHCEHSCVAVSWHGEIWAPGRDSIPYSEGLKCERHQNFLKSSSVFRLTGTRVGRHVERRNKASQWHLQRQEIIIPTNVFEFARHLSKVTWRGKIIDWVFTGVKERAGRVDDEVITQPELWDYSNLTLYSYYL